MDAVLAFGIEQLGQNLDVILAAVSGGIVVAFGFGLKWVAKLTKGTKDDEAAQKFVDENK